MSWRLPRILVALLFTIFVVFLCSSYSPFNSTQNDENLEFLLQKRPDDEGDSNNDKHELTVSDKNTERIPRQEYIRRDDGGPPIEMERPRRHIAHTSRDIMHFVRIQFSRLRDIYNKTTNLDELKKAQEDIIKYILDNLVEYQSVMEDQLQVLADNDGWKSWRIEEAKNLQDTMKERLHALQNPRNCSQHPVSVCNLESTSGFGSSLHDVLWCFIKAYHLGHRMVLETKKWHYAPNGWDTLFKPLSDNCSNEDGPRASTGSGENNDKGRPFLRALPSDLESRIVRMHSNPLAWWYGQFLHYLMRPNDKLNAYLENVKKNIDISGAIVGVHVRRTDKAVEEAKAHSLEEYMEHVEDYFTGLELKNDTVNRKIYLATDDPSVIKECKTRYENYTCYCNEEGADRASNMKTRYENTSLWGVLADVFMLANTDFLVCTFSSNLCRLAYELRHAFQLEAPSDRVISIDAEFYYANVSPPWRRALYNHKGKSASELSFSKRDLFRKDNEWSMLYEAIGGKSQNGFAEYVSKKDGKKGLIPMFKTQDFYEYVVKNNSLVNK